MMTYQELEMGTSFDWWKALEEAEDWHITDNRWSNLTSRAGSWVTCACGNQCAIIPRDSEGEPKDEELSDLGLEFYSAIMGRHLTEAAFILCEIEQRSMELIKELKKK